MPILLRELYSWLESQGVAAPGKPFIRYVVVDYNNSEVDVDVGVPVETSSLRRDDRIETGVLPAGRYATTIHLGAYDSLVNTTRDLLEWGKAHGVRWQVSEQDYVTTWACRVEHYLIGPDDEPNHEHWQTEVAILVAEED